MVTAIDPVIPFLRSCTKEIIRSVEAATGPEIAQIGILRERLNSQDKYTDLRTSVLLETDCKGGESL